MRTFDIMVDIDDVIVPWFETVDAGCRAAWGDHFPVCSNWHMWEHYGVTQEEWTDVVIQAVQTGLYHTTDPIPGSVEAINRMRWFGHRIHIVTARGFMANGDNIRQWTPEYLERFGIGYDTLLFAKDKFNAQFELGVPFDLAIDDGYHNYERLDGGGVEVWLHTAPHNEHLTVERRVGSLWDFSTMVLERAGNDLSILEPTG